MLIVFLMYPIVCHCFESCIDRNATETLKDQKDINKLVHVMSVVQP